VCEVTFQHRNNQPTRISGICLALLTFTLLCFQACGDVNDVTCQNHPDCKRAGLCVASEKQCVARDDAHCQQSDICKEFGECTHDNGRCIASTDAECRQSIQCSKNALCLARKGQCVEITDGYCKTHDGCTKEALCTLDQTFNKCIIGSSQDCAESTLCKQDNKCILEESRCTLSDAFCKKSEGCKKEGLCARRSDTCLALNDSDCLESDACRLDNKCTAIGGKCIASEANPTEQIPDGGTQEVLPETQPETSPERAPETSSEQIPENNCFRPSPGAPCAITCNPSVGVIVGSTCPAGMYCQFSTTFPPGYCSSFPQDTQKNGSLAEGSTCSNARVELQCNGPDGLVCLSGTCAKACDPRRGVRNNPLCQNSQLCLNAVNQSYLGGICQDQFGPPTQQVGDPCGSGVAERCISTTLCVELTPGDSRCMLKCTPNVANTCPLNATCTKATTGTAHYCVTQGTQRLGESCDPVNKPCVSSLICIDLGQPICFQRCDANTPCTGGQTCTKDALGRSYCLKAGTRTIGESCNLISNRCTSDLRCINTQKGSFCRKQCDPNTSNDCPTGTLCQSFNNAYYCGAPRSQSVGEDCDDLSLPCQQGMACVGFRGSQLSICHRICDPGTSGVCGANETCYAINAQLNVCQPTGSQREGEVCDFTRGCAQGLACRTIREDGESLCMQPCNPQKVGECRTGFECAAAGFCQKQGTQKALFPCDDISLRCVKGLRCLRSKLYPPVCALPCDPRLPNSCGSGRTCQGVTPDANTFYCLPNPSQTIGESCDGILKRCGTSQACIGDAYAAYCYLQCDASKSSNQCPVNSFCEQGDTNAPDRCVAKASQGLGDPCNYTQRCLPGLICRGVLGQQTCHQLCDPKQSNNCTQGFVCEQDQPSYCKRAPTRSMGEECDPFVNRCISGLTCSSFFAIVPHFTCKQSCDPTKTNECPQNYFCARLYADAKSGICRNTQSRQLGETCNLTTQPCAPDASCLRSQSQAGVGSYCAKSCDPRQTGQCPTGTLCDFDASGQGFCQKLPSQKEDEECDAVTKRCISGLICQLDEDKRKCIKPCRPNQSNACGVGKTCQQLFDGSSTYACLPTQVRNLDGPCDWLTFRCKQGLSCIKSTTGRFCKQRCNPFQGVVCPTNFSCESSTNGFYCLKQGTQKEGSYCNAQLRCEPGLVCAASFNKSQCIRPCDPTKSGTCAQGTSCQAFDPTLKRYFCLPTPSIQQGNVCNHLTARCVNNHICLGDNTEGRCYTICDTNQATNNCATNYSCRKGPKNLIDICVRDGTQLIDERCGGTLQCTSQLYCQENLGVNYCVQPCDPTQPGSNCPSGRTCQKGDPVSALSFCYKPPTQKTGDACNGIDKRCVSGNVCLGTTGNAFCYKQCTLNTNNTCPGGFTCTQTTTNRVTFCLKDGTQTEGQTCDNNKRCIKGLNCVVGLNGGYCKKPCQPSQQGQCKSTQTCQRLLPTSSLYFCFAPAAQNAGDVCDGVKQRCKSGAICLNNRNTFKCYETCDLQNPTCPSQTKCVGINATSSVCVPVGNAIEGERCNQNSDCQSGLKCIDDLGQGRCLKPCSTTGTNTCSQGRTCQSYSPDQQASYCLPAPTKQEGQPCQLSQDRCVSGSLCLGANGAGVCKFYCTADGTKSCPSGRSCYIEQGERGYCLISGRRLEGEVCALGDACRGNLICRGAFGSRVCLTACQQNASTCGQPRTCQGLVNNQNDRYCLNQGSVAKGGQCDLNNRCQGGLVCQNVDSRFLCLRTCNTNSVCSTGETCQEVETNTKVCLPTPTQQEGQQCSPTMRCLTGLKCQWSQGAFYCLKPCTSGPSNTCSTSQTCAPLFAGANVNFCLNNASQQQGQPCDGTIKRCVTGLVCRHKAGVPSVCLKTCDTQTPNTCPAGSVCQRLNQNSAYCEPKGTAKVGEFCTQTKDCLQGLTCVQSATGNVCLQSCAPSQSGVCPTSQSCTKFNASDTVGFCLKNPTQQAGDACDVINKRCTSNLLCIGDAQQNTAFCRAPCNPTQNQNCPTGETCLIFGTGNGYCLKLKKENEACSSGSPTQQCEPGLQCIQSICLRPCDPTQSSQCFDKNGAPVAACKALQGVAGKGYCVPQPTAQEGTACETGKLTCLTGLTCTCESGANCAKGICLKGCNVDSDCTGSRKCETFSEFRSDKYCFVPGTALDYQQCDSFQKRCQNGQSLVCHDDGSGKKCLPKCQLATGCTASGRTCSIEVGPIRLCH